MTDRLLPLVHSHEVSQIEKELKGLFIKLYDEAMGATVDDINVYGVPHLGSFSLVERSIEQDGLTVLRETTEDRIRYLFKAWRNRNPERGLFFLELYLKAIFGDFAGMDQMWQRKNADYPTALMSLEEIEANGEDLNEFFLTSRVRVQLDTDVVPGKLLQSLRSAVAARLLLNVQIGKSSAFGLGLAHVATPVNVARLMMIATANPGPDPDPDPLTTASLTQMGLGSSLLGSNKWIGGVLAPDNKIYGIPNNYNQILIIDPAAGTASLSNMGAALGGLGTGNKWFGGALAPNGKIYSAPHNANDILIIDPVAGAATRSTMGIDLGGSTNSKWSGLVAGPDGKLYGIPGAMEILIIDPVAGVATRSSMGAPMSASPGINPKWFGGALGPDGKIYAMPHGAKDILIIDPVAGVATRSSMGVNFISTPHGMYHGGVLGPDGKIYGIPFSATEILIIDPAAGTASLSNMGADLTGVMKWAGGALGPDGRIYCVPHYAPDILIIDPASGTATRSSMNAEILPFNFSFNGAVLGPNNKVYGIPYSIPNILVIE